MIMLLSDLTLSIDGEEVFRRLKLYVSDSKRGRSSNGILKLSRSVDEALESK